MSPGDPASDLERLPGVLAATLFLDNPRTPRVYLAIADDADTDAIRATAASLLLDHGFPADTARIHVGRAPRTVPFRSLIPRVALDSLDIHRSDLRVECTVHLRAEARAVHGSAIEPDSPSGRPRAAARATLHAAEALDPDFRFGLEGLRALDAFGHPLVLVLLEAAAGRTHAFLPGSALVDRSPEEAAALATLAALRLWTA